LGENGLCTLFSVNTLIETALARAKHHEKCSSEFAALQIPESVEEREAFETAFFRGNATSRSSALDYPFSYATS
jgi:hypothetical protein